MSISDAHDRVFKALSAAVRRQILDDLRDQPLTTGTLCTHFPELDRCTVMQHLKVLEEADLVTVVLGAPTTFSPGAIWFRINANSLVGFQALIEKGPLPWLWPPIQELLILPTWLILLPPGLVLVLACKFGSRRSPA